LIKFVPSVLLFLNCHPPSSPPSAVFLVFIKNITYADFFYHFRAGRASAGYVTPISLTLTNLYKTGIIIVTPSLVTVKIK
jgi:hypothetical protein